LCHHFNPEARRLIYAPYIPFRLEASRRRYLQQYETYFRPLQQFTNPVPVTRRNTPPPPGLQELVDRREALMHRMSELRSRLPYNPDLTVRTFRLRFPMSAEEMTDITRDLRLLSHELQETERQIALTRQPAGLEPIPLPQPNQDLSRSLPDIQLNTLPPSTNAPTRPNFFALHGIRANLLQRIGEVRAALPFDPDSTEASFTLRFPISATRMTHINRHLNHLNNELRAIEQRIATAFPRPRLSPQPEPSVPLNPNLIQYLSSDESD